MFRLADTPIWVRLTGAIWLVMIVAWVGMIVWSGYINKNTSIKQAKSFAGAVNEMTLAGLTGMMITGTVAQRDVFLDQIQELSLVRDLKVIRGEAVSKLFGPGPEDSMVLDDLEKQVMQGAPAYMNVEDNGEFLRVVIPTVAQTNYLGKDCVVCHQVTEGTLLGAVSMRISLDQVKQAVTEFRVKSIVYVVGASLLLLVSIYLFIKYTVSKPLSKLREGLYEIAEGSGDLTRLVSRTGNDEIGKTAKVFNDMLSTITALVRQASESATAVAATAHHLVENSMQLADSVHQQNNSAAEAAQEVNSLTQNIAEIAESAEKVHLLSRESQQASQSGQERLGQLGSEVSNVEKSVNNMAEIVKDFIQSTEAIARITVEVRGIADQTNLLALNAAIEAARAGESGRGFAVVADSVRELAEKSAQSAEAIHRIAHEITQRSSQVQTSVGESMEHLHSGHQSVNMLQDVMVTANRAVLEVGHGLDKIAGATEGQRSSSKKVIDSIDEIVAIAEKNDEALKKTVIEIKGLEKQASLLQDSVSRFNV